MPHDVALHRSQIFENWARNEMLVTIHGVKMSFSFFFNFSELWKLSYQFWHLKIIFLRKPDSVAFQRSRLIENRARNEILVTIHEVKMSFSFIFNFSALWKLSYQFWRLKIIFLRKPDSVAFQRSRLIENLVRSEFLVSFHMLGNRLKILLFIISSSLANFTDFLINTKARNVFSVSSGVLGKYL